MVRPVSTEKTGGETGVKLQAKIWGEAEKMM